MTAAADPLTQARKMGAKSWIRKPFGLTDLLVEVKHNLF